jgi:hypothetical protein
MFMPQVLLWISPIIIGGGFVGEYFGYRQQKKQSRLKAQTLIPINAIQAGQMIEVQGLATCGQPLTAPFSKQLCVYYEFTVQQMRVSTDQQGHTSRNWETIHSDRRSVPFWLQDQSGQLAVYPEGASFDARATFEGPIVNDMIGVGGALGGILSVFDSANQRVQESAILLNALTLVVGTTVSNQQGLAFQKLTGDYIISYRSKEQLDKHVGQNALAAYIFSSMAIIGGVILLILGMRT